MNFFLLINVKILTFMSGKNSILGFYEPKKSQISRYFYTYEHLKFHAQSAEHGKSFITLGQYAALIKNHTACGLAVSKWV